MFAKLFRKHVPPCSYAVYGTRSTHVRIVELLTSAINADEAKRRTWRTNWVQVLVRLRLLFSSSAPNLLPMGMPSGSKHQTGNFGRIPGDI